MPNNFSLSVDGLDRVITAFEELKTGSAKRIDAKLSQAAQNTLSSSQGSAPVATGALRDSGRVDHPSDFVYEVTYGDGSSTPKTYSYPGNQVMGSMEADGYVWFNELGTSKMSARPYLGPPFEEESQKLVTSIGDILGG